MRLLLTLGAVSVLISGSAWAESKEATKKNDGDKIVCKTEQFVGSMIPRRVCLKKSEWEAAETDAKDAVSTRNQRPVPISNGNSGG
jgi:hypothetical protein